MVLHFSSNLLHLPWVRGTKHRTSNVAKIAIFFISAVRAGWLLKDNFGSFFLQTVKTSEEAFEFFVIQATSALPSKTTFYLICTVLTKQQNLLLYEHSLFESSASNICSGPSHTLQLASLTRHSKANNDRNAIHASTIHCYAIMLQDDKTYLCTREV